MVASLHYISQHPLFYTVLALAFAGTPFLTSLTSGWHKLSKRFSRRSTPMGQIREPRADFYHVRMRGQVYGPTLQICAADDALYLSMPWPLRPAYPPLAIPWGQIELVRRRRFGFESLVLLLGDKERVPLRIDEEILSQLGIVGGPLEQRLGGRPDSASAAG